MQFPFLPMAISIRELHITSGLLFTKPPARHKASAAAHSQNVSVFCSNIFNNNNSMLTWIQVSRVFHESKSRMVSFWIVWDSHGQSDVDMNSIRIRIPSRLPSLVKTHLLDFIDFIGTSSMSAQCHRTCNDRGATQNRERGSVLMQSYAPDSMTHDPWSKGITRNNQPLQHN